MTQFPWIAGSSPAMTVGWSRMIGIWLGVAVHMRARLSPGFAFGCGRRELLRRRARRGRRAEGGEQLCLALPRRLEVRRLDVAIAADLLGDRRQLHRQPMA